jgi:protocatechuate 3,4-dioxygenase, beta subunit
MKRLRSIVFFIILLHALSGCNGQHENASSFSAAQTQTKKMVGGGCDGCELMFTGMPSKINAVDTNETYFQHGQKLLVRGTAFKLDGKTPAPGVIIYYYHTDSTGHYTKRNDKPANQTVHGHIRGWVKTDANGKYLIYTSRPAPYPGHEIPAHIHIVIKEPNLNEYYIDELVFDADPLLTAGKRSKLENRGGNGILKLSHEGNLQVAEHNIILGLNIPDYEKN